MRIGLPNMVEVSGAKVELELSVFIDPGQRIRSMDAAP